MGRQRGLHRRQAAFSAAPAALLQLQQRQHLLLLPLLPLLPLVVSLGQQPLVRIVTRPSQLTSPANLQARRLGPRTRLPSSVRQIPSQIHRVDCSATQPLSLAVCLAPQRGHRQPLPPQRRNLQEASLLLPARAFSAALDSSSSNNSRSSSSSQQPRCLARRRLQHRQQAAASPSATAHHQGQPRRHPLRQLQRQLQLHLRQACLAR